MNKMSIEKDYLDYYLNYLGLKKTAAVKLMQVS